MTFNWLGFLAALLLFAPVVLGFLRGLPDELALTGYRLRASAHSLLWLAAYLIAPWVLQTIILQNPAHLSLFRWAGQFLRSGLFAWLLGVPLVAALVFWLFISLAEPVLNIPLELLRQGQRWSWRLPRLLGRILAGLLEAPRGLLHLLLLVLAVHLALTFGHFPFLARQAGHSSLYRWADSQIVSPLLAGALTYRPGWGQRIGKLF